MTRFFLHIFSYFIKRKALLIALTVGLIAFCGWLVSKVSFSEDIAQFLPENEQNEQANFAYQNIGATNTILVYFSADEESKIMDAIDFFGAQFSDSIKTIYIKKLQTTVDESAIANKIDFIAKNLPYFLDSADYQRIDTLLTEQKIAEQLRSDKEILQSIYGGMMRNVISSDPLFLSRPLLEGLQNFQLNDKLELRDGYLFLKDKNEGIVRIESRFPLSETSNNKELLAQIDSAILHTQAEFKNLKIEQFGAAQISVGNAEQIKKDSFLTIGVAVIFILIILFYSFRSIKIVLTLPLTLGFGMLFALALTGLIFDEVSLIAVGISSLIIGIAANYPLHFLDHKFYGYSTKQTLSDIVSPLTIGNITTVGAFLSLLFISSPAMKNLGFFASMLLVGTILFVLIVLPHIIPENSHLYGRKQQRILRRLTDFEWDKKTGIVLMVVLLTIIFFFCPKADFNADMHQINYITAEQKLQVQKMQSSIETTEKKLYVCSDGKTIDEALENHEAISNKLKQFQSPNVRLTGIGNYLPSQKKQAERIALWKNFWKDKNTVEKINQLANKEGFTEDAFREFEAMISAEYTPKPFSYFAPITTDLAENFLIQTENRAMVMQIFSTDSIAYDRLNQTLTDADFLKKNNSFVFNNQSVISQIINSLSKDFDFVLGICSLIVFVFLYISFGRLELTLIAFLPLAISWIWILALMHFFGMQFNIINIILATFIFGMGDDYTIFITEGCIYENRYGKKMLSTYKSTIALSAVIMFVGIGVLILAKHPAMRQLGEVVIIGMSVVVLMAYIIPPYLFRYLTQHKNKKRIYPERIKNRLASWFVISTYGLGVIILSIVGFTTLTILGKTERNQAIFRKLFRKISSWIITHIPLSKLTIENLSGNENPFQKPSVIVSNHQSLFDALTMIMLVPKIIIVTKDWVWESPFWKPIIRYANFYPIQYFEQKDTSEMEELVKQGFSIMMFPEGTRTTNGEIHRYHKGAFLLAQRFNLPIQPIVIHGFNINLSKGTLYLQKVPRTIHILPIVESNNIEYQELTKKVKNLSAVHYAEMRNKLETVDFYAEQIINNYLYKGKEIETQVRKQLKTTNNFRSLVEKIPTSGNVLLTNVGYGAPSLMSALVRRNTHIYALITNNDDFSIATHCAGNPSNLHYIKTTENITFDEEINYETHKN